MKAGRFQSSDAWIFLSIMNTKGVDLRTVIATADYINHAIPTKEEIEGAVNRLAAAGLIGVEGGLFKLTPSGSRLYGRIAPSGKSLIKAWKELEQYFNSAELPAVRIKKFKFKAGQFEAAHKQYTEQF
ncbi:MAG TPA: hypothetical protein VHM28_00590 [Anaerolineales bacterium]|jgi:hypothetical protein|nr:hypothetical protein [Anaerolineales bacterium]